MPDCQLRGAAGKRIVMATLKIKLLQSFLAAPAFGRCRCILWILTLNPTHKFVIKICIFSTGTEILRAGPPSPLGFLFFVFSHPPTTSNTKGRPLITERSKTLRPDRGLVSERWRVRPQLSDLSGLLTSDSICTFDNRN